MAVLFALALLAAFAYRRAEAAARKDQEYALMLAKYYVLTDNLITALKDSNQAYRDLNASQAKTIQLRDLQKNLMALKLCCVN